MNKEQLTRQLELLHKDLSKCDKRCKKISKACGLEDNHLIEYAMEQTKLVLDYIESLKGEDSANQEI
ncbi:hypothetical protein D3C81_1638400 [compost metagenome]